MVDDQPVIIRIVNRLMGRLGKKPITSKVSKNVAYGVGLVMEFIWRTLDSG